MSVQSEIDRINGAKSTLAANIESAGFTAVEGASIVQLASTVGDAFTDTSSRLATVNGASGTINTQLDTLDGTKTAIKDAIVAKGVEVPDGTTFYEYAGKIGEIETGGGLEEINFNVYVGQKPSAFLPGKQIGIQYIKVIGEGSFIASETVLADYAGSSYDLYTYKTLKGISFSVRAVNGMTFSKYNGDLHAVSSTGDTVEDVISGTTFYALGDVDLYYNYPR